MLEGFHFGDFAAISAGLHPVPEALVEGFLDFGQFGLFGEISHLEGIFYDIVEFELGAQLVARSFSEGIWVAVGGESKPALEFGSSGAGVHELDFGGEVPDQFVGFGANRANPVVRGAIVDSACGHDSVDKFVVGLFSGENREEAFTSKVGGRGAAGGFDEGGEEVEIFDHGGVF